jgi:hypothetical protein
MPAFFCQSDNALVPSCNHQGLEQGSQVDLTPGEKAVLKQIRALYATEARREHQLKALMMQWPPIHHEAYKRAYGGLLAKLLIQDVNAQVFRLTEMGLSAIGVAHQKRRPSL